MNKTIGMAACGVLALALAGSAMAEGNYHNMFDFGDLALHLKIAGALLAITPFYILWRGNIRKWTWLIGVVAIDMAAVVAAAMVMWRHEELIASPVPWVTLALPAMAIGVAYEMAVQAAQRQGSGALH